MIRYVLFLFLLIAQYAYTSVILVLLGNEKVNIEVLEGKGRKAFIHLHQNETTALKAARVLAKKEGDGLLTLHHSGGRTISFCLEHKRFEFDPNRIFTDKGIAATLKTYSHYSPDAHKQVKKLADAIIDHMPKGKVVAVHNNKSYSSKDYLPGHKLESDAKKLYLSSKQYFRNFFFVTQYSDFTRLKSLGFNSILQKENVRDDGSLSVFLGKRDYINVEAGYDQLNIQIKMLKTA